MLLRTVYEYHEPDHLGELQLETVANAAYREQDEYIGNPDVIPPRAALTLP